MRFPTKQEVETLRKRYPPGTKVRLISMEDDPRPIPPGTEGVVKWVDDAGTVHTDWQNGSGLGFIPGKDIVEVIE